jgi:hypothetical protein
MTKSPRVPASFCILTDCAELEREFLDDRVERTLEKFDDLLISIHFTDQNTRSVIFIFGAYWQPTYPSLLHLILSLQC